MHETVVDESHPAYEKFLACFVEGASLQDIYTESEEGFAVRTRRVVDDPAVLRKLRSACRTQFDRIFSHQYNLAAPIAQHIGLEGKNVLDFGSGTGALAVAVALRGATVTATDPTAISLDACNWRARYFDLDASRVRTVQIGIEPGLPFPDGSFDMVTCNSVFEFIPERRDLYIRELVRVLRPGGHLILSTENGLFPVDYYTRRLFPLFRRSKMRSINAPYGLTYFELKRWLRNTGRGVNDLSKLNAFNSMDHFVTRRREAGGGLVAEMANAGNVVLKRACSAVGLSSQIFFPYTTFMFELH